MEPKWIIYFQVGEIILCQFCFWNHTFPPKRSIFPYPKIDSTIPTKLDSKARQPTAAFCLCGAAQCCEIGCRHCGWRSHWGEANIHWEISAGKSLGSPPSFLHFCRGYNFQILRASKPFLFPFWGLKGNQSFFLSQDGHLKCFFPPARGSLLARIPQNEIGGWILSFEMRDGWFAENLSHGRSCFQHSCSVWMFYYSSIE